jgi:site-specific DNA recombinase
MNVAIYARKSQEQGGIADEAKSIARQIEHARAYAVRKGWTVRDAHIYEDDGVSGALFDEARRPGLARLLNAARATPRPFEGLVMSEESRLGREQFQAGWVLHQLAAAGLAVHYYLDDRAVRLDDATGKFMEQVRAYGAEMERERARQRTKDALARKARHGYVTGGVVFGFRNQVVLDAQGRRSHVERAIDHAEAAVVRRIFELCAAGYGLRSIAIMLNDEGALAPTPRREGRPRGWAPSSVRSVLYRDLYRGVLHWNRSTKRGVSRPESEWIETPVPNLRIVSDALWQSAHERLRGVREGYQRATGGVMHGRPLNGVESKYLLTGFAVCGCCNGSLHVRSRRSSEGRLHVYACTIHYYRHLCDNRALLPLRATEDAVLGSIAADILHPEFVRRALRYAQAQLATPAAVDRKAVTTELHAVEAQLINLTTAIRIGGDLPTLVEELRAVERQRARLQALLKEPVALPEWRRIEVELRRRLDGWRGLLRRHVFEARGVLRELMTGKIRFTPEADGQGALPGGVQHVAHDQRVNRVRGPKGT